MYDSDVTISDFLEGAAAKQPAPGGGSVAALAGALAAAMGEMVLNYSVGKKNLAQYETELCEALKEMKRARMLLGRAMVEDQLAYEALSAAKKMPPAQPARQEDLNISLLASIRVPQTMAATALAVLELCETLVDKVNPFLLSDLAVCCELSMATIRCAAYNVRANLPDLTDARDRAEVESTSDRLIERGVSVIQKVIPRIWARQGKSA